MDNVIINKLIKKINFDLADKFELAVAKELSFVPVNMQNNVFFIAVYSNSNKAQIIDYVGKVINNKVEFIYLTKENFDQLFDAFLKKYSAKYGKTIEIEDKAEEDNEISFELDDIENIDELDDDLNINNSDDGLVIDDDITDDEDNDEYNDTDNDEFETDIYQSDSSDAEEIDDLELEDDASDIPVLDENITDVQINDKPKNKPQPPKAERKVDIKKVKSPETKKLGEILIEEGLINEEQLEIALAESKAQSIPLGSILVKMGFVTIKDLKEALGAQMGLKYATAEQLKALPTAISILPEDFVKLNKVIPLSMTEKSLVVGMVNPNDTKVINEIVYQTGLKPTVMLVTHVEFENFVNTYYNMDKSDADELLQQINEDEKLESNSSELWEQVEQEIQDSDGAVSQLANKIITMAIDRRASDIHIEPLSVGYRVRLRIDGSLQEALRIPAKVDSAVISRFKVLSRMNIAEHRRAQDGSFTLKYKNKAQDFRVNTLPVAGREKMVIRVLAPQLDSKEAKADKIEIAGASEEDVKKIRYLVSSPNGIILTSGPTGSGKTTTLYALLRYMNSDSINITTIEDPVEIKLEGINQSSINTKAGITFANSLRAILRQDPDTILIGEIRDYETLEVAISASLTGHLVLSTVHTNSAAATITRLIEMGAKDYLISSTISGIIAQRLVKKLCPNCKEEYYPSYEEAKQILTDPIEIQKLTQTKLYRPHGCPHCKNSGYLGRLAVMEILVVNNEIRKMIAQRAHDVEIEDYAIKQGMRTLKMSCLKHILEGNTSIEEQVRILGLASEQ